MTLNELLKQFCESYGTNNNIKTAMAAMQLAVWCDENKDGKVELSDLEGLPSDFYQGMVLAMVAMTMQSLKV